MVANFTLLIYIPNPSARSGWEKRSFFYAFCNLFFCFVIENTLVYNFDYGLCPWCNGYRRRKWSRRTELKYWTRLIAFHIVLIPLRKVWIELLTFQVWADWVLKPCIGNQSRRRKTLNSNLIYSNWISCKIFPFRWCFFAFCNYYWSCNIANVNREDGSNDLLIDLRGCPRGVMVKAMGCGIVVSEFVLPSRYYVHFRANTLGKGMNPFILPAMG